MTMRLSLARANVTGQLEGADVEHTEVSVTSRQGRLLVKRGVETIADLPATAIRPVANRRWEVDTPSGTLTVTRQGGGCGCARG